MQFLIYAATFTLIHCEFKIVTFPRLVRRMGSRYSDSDTARTVRLPNPGGAIRTGFRAHSAY